MVLEMDILLILYREPMTSGIGSPRPSVCMVLKEEMKEQEGREGVVGGRKRRQRWVGCSTWESRLSGAFSPVVNANFTECVKPSLIKQVFLGGRLATKPTPDVT